VKISVSWMGTESTGSKFILRTETSNLTTTLASDTK